MRFEIILSNCNGSFQKREFIRKHVTLLENTSNKNFVLEIIVR